MSEPLWAELHSWLEDPDEVAGVLTARVIDDVDGITLIGRRLDRAPPSSYLERRADGMSLRSSGWVPAVRRAGAEREMAIFVHTHPGGTPHFSVWDDKVDEELRGPFLDLTGAGLYGALVLAGGDHRGYAARLRRPDGSTLEVTAVRVVGDRLTIHRLGDLEPRTDEAHDRQLRALGEAGQDVLRGLRVGVVGAGGTGSPILEQLVRLGVGKLVVIDDDEVTSSTVARGYGSSTGDVGRPKVDVAFDHAARIGLAAEIRPVRGNLRDREVVNELRHCDVVFCCVDGHAARVILNRWAYWHLAPVLDVAVLISSSDGRIDGINGRLTWLAPGAACLLCRGRIDPRLAHVEHLDPEERRRLTEQGYAPDLQEPQPSVVTYTSLVASMATTELLNRLFGLADPTPTEVLVQLHKRSISLNRRAPREDCFCGTPSSWAEGTVEPYLDLTWTS